MKVPITHAVGGKFC